MRQLGPDGNGAGLRAWPLWLWCGVIVLLVAPWGAWQSHGHWERVQWTPWVANGKVPDIVANVLLYLPVGYWSRRLWHPPSLWRTIGLALGLSLVTELTQVYSHDRYPAVRDVLLNGCGAWLGAWLGKWGRESIKGDAVPFN